MGYEDLNEPVDYTLTLTEAEARAIAKALALSNVIHHLLPDEATINVAHRLDQLRTHPTHHTPMGSP